MTISLTAKRLYGGPQTPWQVEQWNQEIEDWAFERLNRSLWPAKVLEAVKEIGIGFCHAVLTDPCWYKPANLKVKR